MDWKTSFVVFILVILLLAETSEAAKKKKNKGKDCRRRPCKNGGHCVQDGGNYKCECPEGFTGKRCQKQGGRSDNIISLEQLNCFGKECVIKHKGVCMDEITAKNAECEKITTGCDGSNCVCCIGGKTGCEQDTRCDEKGGECISKAEIDSRKCLDVDVTLCNKEKGCFCCIRNKHSFNDIFGNMTAEVKELSKSWLEAKGNFKPNEKQQEFLDQTANNIIAEMNLDAKTRKKRQAFTWPCVRKEYRNLQKSERDAFHAAIHQMMLTFVSPGVSQYQLMVMLHQFSSSPGAHFGPSFHPWHRVFLLIVEWILKSHDPSVCLPYWDSTLDRVLPSGRDSNLFSHKMMGTASGLVTYGDFAYWPVINSCLSVGTTLTRGSLTWSSLLYSDSIVDSVCSLTQWQLEGLHVGPHMWVGGHMASYGIICAPQDPIFFMHHAFVDYIWQLWRSCPGNGWFYPAAPSPWGAFDPMLPFTPLLNIHGLLPFNPWMYTYAPRPQTCTIDTDCDPLRLWCNAGLCTAKVKLGGSCAGYSPMSASPCECGVCNTAYICQIQTVAQAIACMAI